MKTYYFRFNVTVASEDPDEDSVRESVQQGIAEMEDLRTLTFDGTEHDIEVIQIQTVLPERVPRD